MLCLTSKIHPLKHEQLLCIHYFCLQAQRALTAAKTEYENVHQRVMEVKLCE